MTSPLITEADLAELRADAESLMWDTGYVRRETGEPTTDPDTGAITPTYADVYGSAAQPAKARIKHSVRSTLTDRTVGEQYVQVTSPELQVPVTAVGIKDGDEFVCITSADPNLVGAVFKIADVADGTQQVMRRYRIEAVT